LPNINLKLRAPWYKKTGSNSNSESPTLCIQSGALFAEQVIVGAVSMMILFDFFARLARGVVVMNGRFFRSEFYFSGEP